jgi:Domain of unknown function (DUF5668)
VNVSAANRGSLIGGTWLVGVGVVFLIRQSTGLPWEQAWPLFVILVGVAGLVSTTVGLGRYRGYWAYTWPVAWIVVGVVLLASTTGYISTEPGQLIGEWWPLAVILLGAWFLLGALFSRTPASPFSRASGTVSGAPGPLADVPGSTPYDNIVIPLEGATDAAVRITFGAGQLTTSRAAAGNLVDGTLGGGGNYVRQGPNRVQLTQETQFGLPWLDHPSDWAVGLTDEVPLDLRVDTGASRARLDLGDLRVRSLDIRTGASEARVLLPRAAGETTVHAETGAASLEFEVPAGVAAQIRSKMALGSTQVDEARFPRVGDLYQSPDYGTSANRVQIDVQGGMGSVRIR